jgi:septum formation protein
MIENPLQRALRGHKLILGSGSPRRRAYLEELGLEFEVRTKAVDETYPEQLHGRQISEYLAQLKAGAQREGLGPKEVLITSDTVVWHKGASLAKAEDRDQAVQMLRTLSGDVHQVITSICFTTRELQRTETAITEVKVRELSREEIEYYVEKYRPFDKAGAYGIQEWIGLVGIVEIKGSYPNVVGLPTHLLYNALMELTSGETKGAQD